jgi:outer membrane protein TolC
MAYAQEINYNTIILPANATNISIEEKLVQLAWRNNPENHIVNYNTEIADYELKKAKWNWLDPLGFRGNLNEFTLNPDTSDPNDRAQFYPRYNFSLLFTFNFFAQTPIEIKKRKLLVDVAEENVNAKKLDIRAQVLTLYQRYLLAKAKLELQRNTEQESFANKKFIEDKFKNGQEDVQSYNNILERYSNQKLRLLEVETEFKLAKISLEQVIGVRLEDVISL